MSNNPENSSLVADFVLPVLQGDAGALSGYLADKQAVLVVFWSSVCSHCVRYDGYLNEFENRYPSIGLVAVAARAHETGDRLQAALLSRKLNFPLLHDSDRSLAHRWLVRQTPTAFLIDTGFRVIYRGAIDNFKYPQDADYVPYFDAAIEAFLAGRTPDRARTPSFGCPIESVYYRMPKLLDRR